MKPRLTLRARLLAGHLFPILLLIPLVGLALVYLLETRVIIPALASEMIDQGLLIGELSQGDPRVWINPAQAQLFLSSLPLEQPTTVELLSPTYVVLASSRRDAAAVVGTVVKDLPPKSPDNSPYWGITAGAESGGQILNVMISVVTRDGFQVGLLRIYRRLTDIERGLADMRLLILVVLLVGLAISGAIAFLLSESVGRPLKRLAASISQAPLEGAAAPLSEGSIPEVQEIAHAFNRQQERRQELEETRRRMLANVVHEIGRPLGSLRAAVHALQAGAAEDAAVRRELLPGMAERLQRMGRLLEDLSLSYRGLKPNELELKPVDLQAWLDEQTPLWAQVARQKGLDWQAELGPQPADGEPLELVTDPGRLAQALGNLVDNALKFTPSGGRVALMVQVGPGQVRFQVSDTGPGIPSEEQAHLFTPFYRSVQPGWKAPGLGLGLSIARSIVDSLGGQITLASRPGEGSVFTIILPEERE